MLYDCGLLTDYTLFIAGVCDVGCCVCVALTLLRWPDLARVSVCRGCSGHLMMMDEKCPKHVEQY